MTRPLPQTIPETAAPVCVHATCIAVEGKGLLIAGTSGSGKSGLALEMMALGATLVADDRTQLRLHGEKVIAECPPAILGQIEARGIGILNASPFGPVPLAAVLDLNNVETQRLPPRRSTILLGCSLPLLHKSRIAAFPAALVQYLKAGRQE